MSTWRNVMAAETSAFSAFKIGPYELDPKDMGQRPALLVVDVVTAFLGEEGLSLEASIERTPMSCGPAGWEAMPKIQMLIQGMRAQGFPVIYTTGDKERILGGALRKVIDERGSAGDEVAEIPDSIAPRPDEPILPKSRASAFFGTVLTSLLNQRHADSLIVCGTTTSGCIRATVLDGHALGWPVVVADDACFDRAQLSHNVNLFEMNAKYAKVTSTQEIVDAVQRLN